MRNAMDQKVAARHLKRNAYLYVRQSSLRQVMTNTESTKRQYALRDRALALGWPKDQVIVIDTDQGQSGASADRDGFQKLVSEVSMAHAGIVLGLEVSRLARNSADWHRLLEICALTDTLILDEDGIYDPSHFNDRLLLGLKGTMSEAELHVLRARLRGGVLNKAARGELRLRLPVGFVYDESDRVVIDPDRQVHDVLRLFFATFRRTESAFAVVKHFREEKILFPRRIQTGPTKGEVVWGSLGHSRVLHVLHNPRYAGAFFYGRRRWRKKPGGGAVTEQLPREEWIALHVGAHEGYISWDEYEMNQKRLLANAQVRGEERRRVPPREGPALLQGIAVCGLCGDPMTLRYHDRKKRLEPDYVCQRKRIEHAEPLCQSVPGATIDRAIGGLLVETVTPVAIEVSLAVQGELESRIEEADQLRRKQVERARYEADRAKRRYMRVDPDNRLVADSLEAEWNQRLRSLRAAEDDYERQTQSDRILIDEQQRERMLALATDFPKLWADARTPDRERKRIARLLIRDATLLKNGDTLVVHVRFQGGATKTLTLPRPLGYYEDRKTDADVIKEVDRLLDKHTDSEVARLLDEKGLRSGGGSSFNTARVAFIRTTYGLKSHKERLRAAGMLTARELAQRFNVAPATIKRWRTKGLVYGVPFNDKGEYIYRDPGDDPTLRAAADRAAKIRPVEPGTIGYYVGGAV